VRLRYNSARLCARAIKSQAAHDIVHTHDAYVSSPLTYTDHCNVHIFDHSSLNHT
jgi:hypothetical protein